MKQSLFTIALLIPIFAIFSNCRSNKDNQSVAQSSNLTNKAWIAKTARILRYNGEISSTEMKQLEGKSEDQIIDFFMNDPKFFFTVLDFNLFFLGAKPDNIFSGKELSGDTLQHPSAINSAFELANNGNYLSLFHYDQKFISQKRNISSRFSSLLYGQDLETGETKFLLPIPESDFNNKSEEEKTKIIRQAMIDEAEYIKQNYTEGNKDKICKFVSSEASILNRRFSLETFLGFNQTMQATLQNIFFILDDCSDRTREEFMTRFENQFTKYLKHFDKFITVDIASKDEAPDIKKFKILEVDEDEKDQFTTFNQNGFWRKNINSSTNFNRKRAAYMLQTYFCDNLTPINVAAPTEHSNGNQHASNPSCLACHYKLDPMAGFFKNHGIVGLEFLKNHEFGTSSSTFVFDDQLTIQGDAVNNYLKSWRNDDGASRPWKIGYIRSTTDQSKNSYGENLSDLMQIISNAPEVKQCLVNKMAQYFIGKEQAFDRAWLDKLTKDFTSYTNSSEGFKVTVKTLVKSNAFKTFDADPKTCYDSISNASDRPPCEVAFVFEKNCAACHGGAGGAGGLSLTSWVKKADGQFGFSHKNITNNNEVSRCETLSKIKDRITSTDVSKRMPLFQFMGPQDLEVLTLWTSKAMESCN